MAKSAHQQHTQLRHNAHHKRKSYISLAILSTAIIRADDLDDSTT